MTRDLDDLARTAHDLVTEIASRQISREIAHLAEIEVDSQGVHAVAPPEGFRAPAAGVVMTHVLARSRDVPEATVETRVAVWVSTHDDSVLLARAGSDQDLALPAAELDPAPTDRVRGLINDFVALAIAHVVSSLNVAMQRTYGRESTESVAEYDN